MLGAVSRLIFVLSSIATVCVASTCCAGVAGGMFVFTKLMKPMIIHAVEARMTVRLRGNCRVVGVFFILLSV